MKALKRSVLAMAFAASMASGSVYAQQKLAVVNVQAIFQAIPQAATLQQTIATEFKDEIEVVNRLEKDLQYYMEKQKRDTATMSQDEIAELEKQIVSLREEYATKAQPLQQNIQRRQNEERNKLLALIQQGIDTVAQAEQYDFVLNAGAVTFTKEEHNISQKVIDAIVKDSAGN